MRPSGGTCDVRDRLGRERSWQRGFHLGHAEDARARARHRHAHAVIEARHEHADHGIARGLVAEILRSAACLGMGNEISVMISPSFSAVENMPVKNTSAAIRRPRRLHVRVQRQHRRRIIRRRIVVGDRTAERAAMAHGRIADPAGQTGERGDGRLDLVRRRDVGVPGAGADDELASVALDEGERGNARRGRSVRRASPAAASSSGSGSGRRRRSARRTRS